MKKITFLAISVLIVFSGFAQTGPPQPYGPQPEIGKPLPDFKLENVTHYKKKKASLNDFKGKWLFLDFWFTGCSACIKSLPKVNAIQNELKDQLTWVMIGENDRKHNKGIEVLYERHAQKQKLS